MMQFIIGSGAFIIILASVWETVQVPRCLLQEKNKNLQPLKWQLWRFKSSAEAQQLNTQSSDVL